MKNLAINLLVLATSLGVCLAIAEVISGFLIAHRTSVEAVETGKNPAGREKTYRIHPYYGYEHAATRKPIPIRRTHDGDRLHVIVTGGSVAHQVVRDAGTHFRQVLKSKFNRPIELYQFSAGGFKQPQQLHALVHTILRGRHPDIVINLDGFNEAVLPLAENLPSGTPLDYPRLWNLHSLIYQVDSPLQMLRAKRSFYAYVSSIATAAVPYLPENIGLLYKDAITNWEEDRIDELSQEMEKGFANASQRGPLRKVAERMGRQIADASSEALRVWHTSSVMMAALCSAYGIHYFHFLQPNQNLAGSKPLSMEEEKLVGTGLYGEFAASVYPKLVEAGRSLPKQGVSYMDLTSVFDDVKEQLYVDDCCHVNPKGSRILATAIGEIVVLND